SERKADIPLLVKHFAEKISKEQGIATKEFSKEAIDLLKKKKWPGNIRELRNVIERLIILGKEKIDKKDVDRFA
ncbi:MAG TPA: sigma-54-dependent Fis family transcriptional regulator, partial [Balneolaceae bacterium]|nr:sigma-54-dependent Fis family transcriptional regulator [Balneolaceae bacterium]